ncbi:metalloregulator ArsR/SmtB family transcription factor [Verrucomicrobium sp. BvORR106]|uniref:ArsR/SmtB family transcription factor n=1 Tax=Verrucomicrobium sp. BvORR106 TaxID=1403819 RepID=UPI000570BBE8|nr:metalloregulator ArsR/SmtB family transcription factor [Verrucomicrobium sp. BvORR106]
MSSILKSFALLSDATRVRILALLRHEELSVAELQEILALGQSNISAQLARLKTAGFVTDRRSGKNRLYQLQPPRPKDQETHDHLLALLDAATQELHEAKHDLTALKLVRRKRANTARSYFDALAGKFGRQYIPGRSWKALGETLLHFVPPLVIADLGAGEGVVSQMLAQHAKQVIAVDNSEKMVAYGASLAQEHGFANLDYRLGDIEDPPIADGTVDVALFSQALHHASRPEQALAAARRILKPGGRVIVLDLLRHSFEKARLLYADVWLGFSEVEIHEMLERAGFEKIEIRLVDREPKSPHFQTLLAVALKP